MSTINVHDAKSAARTVKTLAAACRLDRGLSPRTRDILSRVRLVTDAETGAWLEATNLELSARVRLPDTDVSGPAGSVDVAPDTLAYALASSAGLGGAIIDYDPVSVGTDADTSPVTVNGNPVSACYCADRPHADALAPHNRPETPKRPRVIHTVRVPSASVLADTLAMLDGVTARGETRYALNGVCVDLSINAVVAVATDTHRLTAVTLDGAAVTLADNGPISGNHQPILPNAKHVANLLRLAGDTPVTIHVGEAHIALKTETVQVFSRLIDGQFPRWREVIPPASKSTPYFSCLKSDLVAFCRAAARHPEMKNAEVPVINIRPAEGGKALLLRAMAGGGIHLLKTILADSCAAPDEVQYNPAYLDDLASMADGDVVRIMGDADRAARHLSAPEGTEAVLMPTVRGGKQAPIPPAGNVERGYESLADALAQHKPRPLAAPKAAPKAKAKAKAAPKTLTLDAVLTWLASASEADRDAVAEAVIPSVVVE